MLAVCMSMCVHATQALSEDFFEKAAAAGSNEEGDLRDARGTELFA